MSVTAELTKQMSGGNADGKTSDTAWAAILSALILALGLVAGILMYCGEARGFFGASQQSVADASLRNGQPYAALLKQSHHWLFWVVIGTAGGVTGLLLAMVKRLTSRRRALEKQVHACDVEWRQTVAGLESQLSDSRKSEEQSQGLRAGAQKRVAELELSNAQLKAELERLKRAGLALTQQQQALTSSKAVLELHVESRTRELQKL